jgi:predicted DNA-binding protein
MEKQNDIPEKKIKFVCFRLTKSDYEKLKSLAEEKKQRRSVLLRTILEIKENDGI